MKSSKRKNERIVKEKENNNLMIPFKNEEEDMYNKISVNGYSILEVNDNIDEEEMLTNNKKIITQKTCENYYIEQYGVIDLEIKCDKCDNNWFNSNELLFFQDKKEILNYIRYCFQYMKKKLFYDTSNYIDNKYELEKLDSSYTKNWKIIKPITVCKSCFMQILNMHNLFGNLKSTFCNAPIETHHKRNSNFLRAKRRRKVYSNEASSISSSMKESCNYNENVLIDNNHNIIIFKKALNETQITSSKDYSSDSNFDINEVYEKRNKGKVISTTINNFNIINNTINQNYELKFIKNLIPTQLHCLYQEFLFRIKNQIENLKGDFTHIQYANILKYKCTEIINDIYKIIQSLQYYLYNVEAMCEYLKRIYFLAIPQEKGKIYTIFSKFALVRNEAILLYHENQKYFEQLTNVYKTVFQVVKMKQLYSLQTA